MSLSNIGGLNGHSPANALIAGITLISGVLFFSSFAFASVSVTAATSGTNISADKAANATSPAYTTLGNIVITEGADTDFAASQSNTTLILTAPHVQHTRPLSGQLK